MAHSEREAMKNEMQKTESPLMAAAALVQQADGKIDVDKLEALLKVQMQWEANEAKKAYVVAMAAFKKKPPEILKDKNVKYHTQKGDVDYKHATLHNVTTCINKALSEHGLTAAWVTSQDNGSVKVTCKITHTQGHSEETCLSAPPDNTGSKNAIQAIGSTVTYLQRYTLLALTGLATADQDDDGAGAADTLADKATKKEEQDKIVDQAFFNFTTENKDALADGFVFSKELFTEAIIKHKGRLPIASDTNPIEKILATVKPEECTVEIREDLDEFPQEED
jgi:hypothetical protein